MSYRTHPDTPGRGLLIAGVAFPLFVLAVEIATGLCGNAFFDPIPTWPHLFAVLVVPATNYALWRAVRETNEDASPWVAVAGGAGLAISAAYTLLFLPILPFAFLGIVLLGIGLLPFSPAFATVAAVKMLNRLAAQMTGVGRLAGSGAAIGFLALVAIDVPATATYLALGWSSGDGPSERRAVRVMRGFGDRRMLLRLCYGDDGRATGLVSVFASLWRDGIFDDARRTDTAAARELYFRTTGEPFNAAPMPRTISRGGARGRLFAFDADQGGTAVGGRAEGLTLDQSRIDGSVSPADNLAYFEWTAEFANASAEQREARLTLAMPAGAVASRATLWVNGEPREASIGGRGAARAAYQSVVRARRDPLLVTTDGADRLLVQAFPVQPGVPLKLRIGMTAPLTIARDGTRSIALPTVADRNFDVASDFAHSVWIEGDGRIDARGGRFQAARLAGGAARLHGDIPDADLVRATPRIVAPPITTPSVRTASLPAKNGQPRLSVTQTIARTAPERPRALTILLDGSVGNRAAGEGLAQALDAIPAGRRVGLVIAADEPVTIAPARWSPAHAAAVRAAIEEADFAGGQDFALADALAATTDDEADLLWVHGPQPVAFARSQARIAQYLERDTTAPRLIRYQAVPGPSFAIDGAGWFDRARTVAPTGDAAADLTALIAELTSTTPRWASIRSEGGATGGATGGTAGSPHIARLWGAERIAAEAVAAGPKRDAVIALARRLDIVTPVSGAVVLERDVEYEANGLDVPDAADVPTVPEPGEWALMIVLAALAVWMTKRRRMALRSEPTPWRGMVPA